MEKNNNEVDQFRGKVLKIYTENHGLPLFGKLVDVSDAFLTIERKDGRLTLVKRKHLISLEPTRLQPSEAV